MDVLGIDIGGSGIKGAPVDLATGQLTAERHRISTPEPSTPVAVAEVVAALIGHFAWDGPVGCTVPAVVAHGVVRSAANIDDEWIDTDGRSLLEAATGCPVALLNDADAAGIAEMQWGAGVGRRGVVMMLTFGTGIGSAIFVDGVLVPNTELGHLQLDGHEDIEDHTAARARKDEKLSWKGWARRVDRYLGHLERIFSPDLFIVGGGVSRRFDKFSKHLHVRADIVPARMRNNAGIAGAAWMAQGL